MSKNLLQEHSAVRVNQEAQDDDRHQPRDPMDAQQIERLMASRAQPEPSLQEKIAALKSVQAYDDMPGIVEAIETHFAWIFLAGDYAYKLKKPVQTSFLDLSALADRQANCRYELHLNRRISPQVYLGVVPLLRRADGSLGVGGIGTPVDWLVKMRRLPRSMMLDELIAKHAVPYAELLRVGRLLADFYRKQPRIDFSPMAYLDRLGQQIHADYCELCASDLGLDSELIESTFTAERAAFSRAQRRLSARAEERRILEAHGDLRPEHICCIDPPAIIDALEFSHDLRILDPAEELAFLSVECSRAGDGRAGEAILSGYTEAVGDDLDAAMLNFYRSRRATIRAKITAWHLRDPAVSTRGAWREQAGDYLIRAREYAWRSHR